MAKTVSISEDSIVAMLKGLPEETLVDIFSRTLIQSDTSRLTAQEKRSYTKALAERNSGKTVTWEDLK